MLKLRAIKSCVTTKKKTANQTQKHISQADTTLLNHGNRKGSKLFKRELAENHKTIDQAGRTKAGKLGQMQTSRKPGRK